MVNVKVKIEEDVLTSVKETVRRARRYVWSRQHPDGYWWEELESNPTMEAEYLMLTHFLGVADADRWRKLVNFILSKQRDDGSWGQYLDSPGNLSTSVECYFALKLAGVSADSPDMVRAREFILSKGGVPRVRVFTKIWLSLFGQWEWKGTPVMPPELMFLPTWFPFNLYEFASWARATIVPLLIILTGRPVRPIPESAAIDELFPTPRDRTDYSMPRPNGLTGWRGFFHIADKLLRLYERSPIKPGRGLATCKAVEWILSRQEADGCWGGIQPPWVYSLIALKHLGYSMDHPVMKKGFEAFERYAIEEEDTWRVQACISPVWDTALVTIALLDSGVAPDDPAIQQAGRWLVKNQILNGGDWLVKNRKAPPGGWAFEFDNDNYPDLDDVSEVIMALNAVRQQGDDERRRTQAIKLGADWLLSMQSSNGGWAAFDKDNTKAYMAKIPFADFGEALDPPSADVTAHVVEMMGKLGLDRSLPCVKRAYRYIRDQQEPDGAWFGRWGVNYIYGTGAVLPALEAIGEDMSQEYVAKAIDWVVDHQNDDGGWGESCGSYVDPTLRGAGPSTASQTAWALMALLAGLGENALAHRAVARGVQYLVNTQQEDGSWDEPYFTGTGFPGYGVGERLARLPGPGEEGYQGLDMPVGFMINYHMYRNLWPLAALGRYLTLAGAKLPGDRILDTRARHNGGLFNGRAQAMDDRVLQETDTDTLAKSRNGRANGMSDAKVGATLGKTDVGHREPGLVIKDYCLKMHATRETEFMDITEQVRDCVADSGVAHGFVVVFSKHTTAAVKLNENEPLLIEDMENLLERLSPRHAEYRHNDFSVRTVNMNPDEVPNGHAHCQHLFLGTSETIPIVDGTMRFGTYQSIFLIELDHPRPREVVVQVLGQ